MAFRWLALLLCVSACRENAEIAGTRVGHLLEGDPNVIVTGLPKLVETGGLSFEILDETTLKRMPGKLTLVGINGTREPRLSRGAIGREEDETLAAHKRAFSLHGLGGGAVPLAPHRS